MDQATLSTERLRLVPLADEHLEYEVELDADPDVMPYLAHGPSSRETTERAHRDRLEQARSMPGMGLWAGFTDQQFVGWWLLRPRSRTPGDREIELGYRTGLCRHHGGERSLPSHHDLRRAALRPRVPPRP